MNQQVTSTQVSVPPDRDARGQLTRGGSRPGAGRKPGSSERDQIRALAAPYRGLAIDALVKVIESAEKPDAVVRAAQELLDRLSAKPRSQAVPARIPGMKEATTLRDKARCVTDAVAEGLVDADSGAAVLRMLQAAADVIRTTDLEERIRKLEGKGTVDHGEDLA